MCMYPKVEGCEKGKERKNKVSSANVQERKRYRSDERGLE